MFGFAKHYEKHTKRVEELLLRIGAALRACRDGFINMAQYNVQYLYKRAWCKMKQVNRKGYRALQKYLTVQRHNFFVHSKHEVLGLTNYTQWNIPFSFASSSST